MPMPTRVQIGPFSYQIHTDPLSVHVMNRDAETILNGQIHLSDGKIVIDASRPADVVRESVLHEVIHGMCETARLRSVFGDRDEEVTSRLSMILLDTLRRNPDRVAYLTEGDA